MFIHEQTEWPNFRWDEAGLASLLAQVRHCQGLLLGRMASLGVDLQQEASLLIRTQDAVSTSRIEGEILNTASVRSSLARQLGLEIAGAIPSERTVDGLVEVLIDATRNYAEPLSEERLFGWHAALFPAGRSGMHRITVGDWRNDEKGPMQVVSGPLGRQKVHFQAPGHARLHTEMRRFLIWFNAPDRTDPVMKSAIAHFYFVTLHPFDDGNGRIARAIGDMQLARSEKTEFRFYSMSAQIQREKNTYYDTLESCQKGTLDLSAWIAWYLHCLMRAVEAAESILLSVTGKASFWRHHASVSLNDRQSTMLNRLLDGFDGKLTSSKWAKIAKCSQDTAQRDINDLIAKSILEKSAASGRSTNYELIQGKDR